MCESSRFLELLSAFMNNYLPTGVNSSPNTIRSYKYAFRLLIEFMFSKKGIPADKITFADLDYDLLSDFFDWIVTVRKCSLSTKNQRLSALLSFSEYVQNRDFDAASVFRNSIVQIPNKKAPKKSRAWFSTEETRILLSLPDERRATGLRDKVLLSTMYASAARAQEICDMVVGNIRFTQVDATIDIHGKGGKTRRISISQTCANLLRNYMKKRQIDHLPDKPVFSSQTHEQMTVSCVEEIVKKYVHIAKEQNPDLFRNGKYSPHSIRHSTATHMLEAGVPLMVIKNFLGHASVQTTQIYAELSQNIVNKHLREWNEKWFPHDIASAPGKEESNGNIPAFLTP